MAEHARIANNVEEHMLNLRSDVRTLTRKQAVALAGALSKGLVEAGFDEAGWEGTGERIPALNAAARSGMRPSGKVIGDGEDATAAARLRDAEGKSAITRAAAEIVGRVLGLSRAGYCR